MVINHKKFSNANAFDEIRSQRRKRLTKNEYKFNQLCVHCLHIKENEERGGAEVEGQEI